MPALSAVIGADARRSDSGLGRASIRKATFCFMGIIGMRAALKLSLPRRSSSQSASACRR